MSQLFANVDLIDLILFAVALVAGYVYLNSKTREQNHAEVVQLADTRAEVIADLRQEIGELRREVAELRGALRAQSELNHEQIAEQTADKLIPFLRSELNKLT